jgi:hypothetical protein
MFYLKGGAAFAEFENNMRLDGNAGPFVFPGQTATRAAGPSAWVQSVR